MNIEKHAKKAMSAGQRSLPSSTRLKGSNPSPSRACPVQTSAAQLTWVSGGRAASTCPGVNHLSLDTMEPWAAGNTHFDGTLTSSLVPVPHRQCPRLYLQTQCQQFTPSHLRFSGEPGLKQPSGCLMAVDLLDLRGKPADDGAESFLSIPWSIHPTSAP